jgi:hypothetical protein
VQVGHRQQFTHVFDGQLGPGIGAEPLDDK